MTAIDTSSVILLLSVVTIPLLLLAAVGLLGWGYRRTLARSMLRSAAMPPWAPQHAGAREVSSHRRRLNLSRVEPADVGLGSASAEQALADAGDATSRVRRAYLTAALVYTAVANVAYWAANEKIPVDAKVTIAYLVLAPQLVILIWFLRLPLRQQLSIWAVYVLTGVLLALVLAARSRIIVLVACADLFALLPLAGLLLLVVRRLQPFLIGLVAILLYFTVVTSVLFFVPGLDRVDLTEVRPWVFVSGLLNMVLGVVVGGWLLGRRRLFGPLLALAAVVVFVVVLGLSSKAWLHRPSIIEATLYGVSLDVVQLLVVWLIFKLFVQLQARRFLPADVLHADLCWGLLTLYSFMLVRWGTALFGDGHWRGWVLVIALALYLLVLHTRLREVWAARKGRPGKRLLLLRVFASAGKREGLLDVLDDTWRRIGRIELITGSDVALRTLGSRMLEAFLLRHVDDEFLKTTDDVDRRLQHLRSEVEGDARYPVNTVNCYKSAWQDAVVRLAPESDAVLMDMRGFTSRNEGCAFELAYLVQRVTLPRIVLLVDGTTDLQTLEQAAHAAWADLPAESPNAHDPQPVLTVLSFEGRRETSAGTLFVMLLRAAFADQPGPLSRS